MCGNYLTLSPSPSWSGYMELATVGSKEYHLSEISILPFIKLQTASPDAIYSSLIFAVEECMKHGQTTCIVTFDQPLYLKASEIVAASQDSGDLSSVVLRLGGFHMLMSYIGAIGYIMRGSGLEEAWSLIYASTSVEKMISGHSYARSLRAHFITQLALSCVLFENMNITDKHNQDILELHQLLMTSNASTVDIKTSETVNTLSEKLHILMDSNAEMSRTSKLWVQYFRQVQLIRHFIRAERSGQWELHIKSVKEMLPHFHAAGHLPYALSAHLYLQQMLNLHTKMNPEDYKKFTSKGFFTIRRSNKFWSGVWTDMTIEQVLMHTMKTSGGLTHGRGVSDSVLTKWVQGIPTATYVSHEIEEFCGKRYVSGEQHVQLRPSRQERDLPHTDSNVVVVGDDIDLLLLLIALADKNVNIYFMKPGRGNIPKKLYSSQQLQQKLRTEMCNCILFFHVATGCDTTSALYRQGKKKAFTMLNNRELLVKIVQIFNEQEQTVSAITAAGEQFLLSVYGSPTSIKSLDLLRHYKFTRNTVSFPIQKPIHLAALPPTSAAAKQHSMRVYLQVQLWYGRELNPTDWGWKMQNNLLIPVTTDLAPAPISLLKLNSCNCKKECGKTCGCRKAGLKCSQLCGICYGGECSNDEVYNDLESEDTDEEKSHEHFHTENSNIAKKICLTNDNDFYSQEFDSSED